MPNAAGFGAIGATTEAPSKAQYYAGTQPMKIKILAELRTGRLLGAQVVVSKGAGTRIAVLATAPWNSMTALRAPARSGDSAKRKCSRLTSRAS